MADCTIVTAGAEVGKVFCPDPGINWGQAAITFVSVFVGALAAMSTSLIVNRRNARRDCRIKMIEDLARPISVRVENMMAGVVEDSWSEWSAIDQMMSTLLDLALATHARDAAEVLKAYQSFWEITEDISAAPPLWSPAERSEHIETFYWMFGQLTWYLAKRNVWVSYHPIALRGLSKAERDILRHGPSAETSLMLREGIRRRLASSPKGRPD